MRLLGTDMTTPATDRNTLEEEYEAILAQLPSRAPIYLPTDKIPLEEKVRTLPHVVQIYRQDLDAVYRPRLRALREQFRGKKRCFLIGNGPSLNETDLSVLKDEVTFAVNGFFLKAKELDWTPTFYLVEDHLVAEDRVKFINEFKGPIKLFPAYLGYMFEASEDTIFYNHRPRKSYPHGFDFSTEADKITYTGCTVTFSMMQIAAYLGFEEIHLIGVDASYSLPSDAKESKDYGVGVLDMQSDDPNHFDPDYFGKGYRWHDPQVDKMVEAYSEARRVLQGTGQTIYNSGIGGQLEVFERRKFHEIFPHARSPEEMSALVDAGRYSRLLVLDMTPFANGTATGEIKANLLGGWPSDRLLQIARHGKDGFALVRPDRDGGYKCEPCSAEDAREAAHGFGADAVLYRPVPDVPWLHALAMQLLQTLNKPIIIWVMDDWPRDLAARDPDQSRMFDRDLPILLEHAQVRLSISEAMSREFKTRYGVPFLPLANGVHASDWPARERSVDRSLRIRYAGGLAANMQLTSVLRLARAIERLGQAGHAVSLEISTQPWWLREAKDEFTSFEFTTISDVSRPPEAYRKWLREADVVVIAYNFDEATMRYVRYSMANKLPECLASGAVLLAHGPSEAATIEHLKRNNLGVVVDLASDEALETAILSLIKSPERRQALGEEARNFVFENNNLETLRDTLRQIVSGAAASGGGGLPKSGRDHRSVSGSAPIEKEARGPSSRNETIEPEVQPGRHGDQIQRGRNRPSVPQSSPVHAERSRARPTKAQMVDRASDMLSADIAPAVFCLSGVDRAAVSARMGRALNEVPRQFTPSALASAVEGGRSAVVVYCEAEEQLVSAMVAGLSPSQVLTDWSSETAQMLQIRSQSRRRIFLVRNRHFLHGTNEDLNLLQEMVALSIGGAPVVDDGLAADGFYRVLARQLLADSPKAQSLGLELDASSLPWARAEVMVDIDAVYEQNQQVLSNLEQQCEALTAAESSQARLHDQIGRLREELLGRGAQADRERTLSEQIEQLHSELRAGKDRCAALAQHVSAVEAQRDEILHSSSWKLTKPLRAMKEMFGGASSKKID